MLELTITSLLILLVKISIAWAVELSTCGQLPHYIIPKMYHSNPTRHWPWHAAIFHRVPDSDPTYECGGTVINRIWILTAGHCVSQGDTSMEPGKVSVSLGRLNLAADETRSEQSFDVNEIVLHVNFSLIHAANDIALVRLSHTATFNYFVRPICLWKSIETDPSSLTGRYGTVVGWGKTETGEAAKILQEARFEVVTHGRCLESNRDFYGTYLTETNFCAGLRNGTSVCKGDSGGSMTFVENGFYYIRGIVSSSPSKINHTTQQLDCDTKQYAIYTDVAMYLQWIRDTTGTGIECQTEVRCVWHYRAHCKVNLHPTKEMCKIIFNEVSDSTITSLSIDGIFESIPDLSDAMNKFENLEYLQLDGLQLQVVDRLQLSAFRRIRFLDLSSNRIVHLEADTFGDCKELSMLQLNDNVIREFHPNIFKGAQGLVNIHLYGNQLEILPQGLFGDNQKLLLIDLHQNQLKELHVDIFKGINDLLEINLNDNKLDVLPQGLFSDNQKLLQIKLGGNQLRELHADTLKGLHKLEKLYLYRNQLEKLPQGLFRDNRNLLEIRLRSNRIKTIESDFSRLLKLTLLNLGGNICIDERFSSLHTTISQINNRIRRRCSNRSRN